MGKGCWIFWTVVAACSIVFTVLVCKYKHVGQYGACAALYPSITEEPERGKICHQIKSILASDDFYSIDFQETNDHKINILAYRRDSTEALAEATTSLLKAWKSCEKHRVQCGIAEEPHIIKKPSNAQYGLYAVLSFLFSVLTSGAIVVTWRQFRNTTPKAL